MEQKERPSFHVKSSIPKQDVKKVHLKTALKGGLKDDPPATVVIVSNNSESNTYVILNTTMSPLETLEVMTAEVAALCSDLAFRVGLIQGDITFTVNGFPFGGQNALFNALTALFINAVSAGDIVIP